MKKNSPITDFDRGYWCAIQNTLSLTTRPNIQDAEELIKLSGLGRERCLTLIDKDSYNGETLRKIVDCIYPATK